MDGRRDGGRRKGEKDLVWVRGEDGFEVRRGGGRINSARSVMKKRREKMIFNFCLFIHSLCVCSLVYLSL